MVMIMTTATATPTPSATATAAATATQTPTPPQIGAAGQERRKFTGADRRAMLQAGIIALEDGIELRDGELFCKYTGARRRFTVDEYYAVAEAGILSPEERVELLAGEIFTMATMGNRHIFCLRWLNKALVQSVGDTAVVDVQMPVLLDNTSEPMPDFAILRWRDDRYRESAKPGPDDVLLVIEVSDTTVRFDRHHKAPLYAAQGIPEMWLFDVNARQVEVYDQPMAGGYARTRIVGIDGILTPGLLPDVAIPVAEVMPD